MPSTARSHIAWLLFACSLPGLAHAFPDGSTRPTAGDVGTHVAGRVFDVALADGTTWRLQYTGHGYLFVDTSKGFRGEGQWRSEDGQLCSQLRGRPAGCNEVRLHQGVLHLQRDSGEIIRLLPR